jgi:hypothetical protein
MPSYIHYQVLSDLPDVFCAASLWQPPGFALFSRRITLRDLLEHHPREVRGKTMSRCFCHVLLTLPQEALDDDRHLARGSRTEELLQTLQQRHQQDFGDLQGDDVIRYQIMADPQLAAHQVGVRFGHALYLPDGEETAQGKLSLSSDQISWRPLCQVYPGQRLLQLAGDPGQTSVVLPNWPFERDAALLLVNENGQFQARAKGKLACRFDGDLQCFVLQHERQRLYIKYEVQASARSDKVWKARPPQLPQLPQLPQMPGAQASPRSVWSGGGQGARADAQVGAQVGAQAGRRTDAPMAARMQAQADGAPAGAPVSSQISAQVLGQVAAPRERRETALSSLASAMQSQDMTYMPQARPAGRLSLVGLALPRLDGYQPLGIKLLEIGLTRQLQICPGDQAVLCIGVNERNQISLRTREGRQNLALPLHFAPFHEDELHLLPPSGAMAERYSATLNLVHPISLPIGAGQQYLFGRGVSACAALRVLDAPHFLQRDLQHDTQAVAESAPSADQLGLSRRAFRYEICLEGLRIARDAANQALFHLDRAGQYVARVDEASYVIPDGHHLVAGNYVLRFDA